MWYGRTGRGVCLCCTPPHRTSRTTAKDVTEYVRQKSGYGLRVFPRESRPYEHFTSRHYEPLLEIIASADFWPKDVVFRRFRGTMPDHASNTTNIAISTDNAPVTAVVIASALSGDIALALRDLAVLVLRDAGVPAEAATAPKSCALGDEAKCLKDVLRALSDSKVSVALVSVPSENSPAAWLLREDGIEELDEVAPPSRRACLATGAPARSLLDLTEADIAANYYILNEDINLALRKDGKSVECEDPDCVDKTYQPEWCNKQNVCATLLTTSIIELDILTSVIRSNKLHAIVRALGTRMYAVAKQLSNQTIIACDWAPEFSSLSELGAERLGPPSCLPAEACPFETRRLVKFVNIRELARAPSAIGAMARFKLNTPDIRNLGVTARDIGHEEAAKIFFKTKPFGKPFVEVRVAVMLPNATSREAYDATALAAAAALAEDDIKTLRIMDTASFKVEMYDDGCHTAQAYKYLNDALGTTEFRLLSALAGPACGAAWADVARQTPNLHLPLLAYTPQAPATKSVSTDSPDTKLQLLAAGDSRESSEIFGELLARMAWKRVAVLSEHATRLSADAAREHVEFAVHVELPVDVSDVDVNLINNWATRVAAADARIIYLCVEDARVARAALCAARHADVTPSNGAVWLLCNEPTPHWLTSGAGENCTTEQLEQVAAGYIAVRPEWESTWLNSRNASEVRKSWEARWRTHCRRFVSRGPRNTSLCDLTPHADAAVLYDTLMMWAASLNRLLKKQPAAIDDLHNSFLVSSLIQDVTTANFSGLTGNFEWTTKGCAYARSASYVLSQWDAKNGERTIGYWSNGTLNLNASLHWFTADGNMPTDGGEYCALQGLADSLHADCRAAYATLGCLLAVMLLGILAGVALYCRRRAEKEYKERLAELGMRPLLSKPVGLDRWEVPRERVVINRKLGTGAFGTVYGGHALLSEERGWTAVAVKTLKAGASMEEKLDFLSEAEAMKRFDHKNVVRLLGVVTKTEPVCTVMEFMLYGDLKNYLLARRHLAMGLGFDDELDSGEADEASPRRLTGMALDVARALSYLASLRYVHRDVAARNCLISARRVVKLADFGMTRLVFENDYYRFSRKGMLPVRWMAPESLALGVFAPASDVWSFGVLLYEIVTFGSLPFQGFSNSEVLNKVKGGQTLELPLGLKPQLENLIKSCWQQDPKTRPTSAELAATLADAPKLLSPCLDVPFDALPLDSDPPWHLPRDQAEARWVSWAAPASATTDTTYLSTDGGAIPLDTESFLP